MSPSINFILVSVIAFAHLCKSEGFSNDIEELSCRDNATCITHLVEEIVNGVRQKKTIKVFDMFSIEPIAAVVKETGRSDEGGVARFFNTHAVRLELGNFAFRVLRSAQKGGSMAVEIEHQEGRGSSGLGGLEGGSSGGSGGHGGHGGGGLLGGRPGSHRHSNKKVMQLLLPMFLGVKTASSMLVAIAAVALLTFKAFLASKLALLVTGTMAVKKILESFSERAPPQHQPYMYPIDFPAPGTHPGYAMPISPFNGAEIYGISGLGGNSHEAAQQQPIHVEQYQDISGQYSQGIAEIQNPNITSVFGQPQQAAKRWDGLHRKPMTYGRPQDYGYQ